MTVKHETIKPRRTATAKGVPHLEVNGAIPHIEVKQEVEYCVNGIPTTPELFADFLRANTPNHPWLGLFAQIGVMAVGWYATMIACSAVVGFMMAGSSSLWMAGLALVVYFFIGCLGVIITMKYAAKAGDYMELRGFDDVTNTVRGWFTRTPAPQGA